MGMSVRRTAPTLRPLSRHRPAKVNYLASSLVMPPTTHGGLLTPRLERGTPDPQRAMPCGEREVSVRRE
jgi:hypothetical protein